MAAPIAISPTVESLYTRATWVPDDFEINLPSDTLPISSLLATEGLPTVLNNVAIELLDAPSCLVADEPRWTDTELRQSPLPPGVWLGTLELELARRIHSKDQPASIRHPSITTLYLPLWAVSVWRETLTAVEERDGWMKAREWLQSQAFDVSGAMELLERIPWGMKVGLIVENSSFGIFTDLLSTRWLIERHLNAYAAYLASRLAVEDPVGWWVGGLQLPFLVKTLPPGKSGWGTDLRAIRDELIAKGYKCLLFPAHVDGNHWIVFRVDVEPRTFRFGAPSHFTHSAFRSTYRPLTWPRGLGPY